MSNCSPIGFKVTKWELNEIWYWIFTIIQSNWENHQNHPIDVEVSIFISLPFCNLNSDRAAIWHAEKWCSHLNMSIRQPSSENAPKIDFWWNLEGFQHFDSLCSIWWFILFFSPAINIQTLISRLIFIGFERSWTFFKREWRELFKNVRLFYSRCFDSWEIIKNKVGKVFWDTL